MSKSVDVHELAGRFEELLASASGGDMVLITDGNMPRAQLVPLPATVKGQRLAGLHAGLVEIASDFDDPLPEEFWTGRS